MIDLVYRVPFVWITKKRTLLQDILLPFFGNLQPMLIFLEQDTSQQSVIK